MFKTIALTLVVVLLIAIVALLAFAATKPDTFRVERQITIKAPADKIFALLNDFHRWPEWSPYENLDPQMQRSYSGEANSKGAKYAWESSGKAGTGHMTITESSAPSKLLIDLDFMKPFEGHNIAEFTLAPESDGTQVKWAMHGPAPFISKVMGTVFNLDKMIGKDFEVGLANLKAASER
ncbi:K(+)-transporting ATPase subunit F [soil metagenome]